MRNAYHQQLDQLHRELKEMGVLCKQAVRFAVRAASSGNAAMGELVREADNQIDRKERDIEALCLKLLLKQQPVAGDLRDISAALKMITDLERIGDQASDIAEMARFTAGNDGDIEQSLTVMSAAVIRMVNDSISAFIQRNLNLAREIIAYDDVVDRLFQGIKEELIQAIARDAANGERWLDDLMVAKYLERIGDHATNVAEWAEYAILGRRSKNGEMIEDDD